MSWIRFTRYEQKISLILLAGLLLTGCQDMPASSSSTMPARQVYLVSQIDHLLDTRQDASQPGLSILITQNGKILYNRSKGIANINQGTHITDATTFDIASVTKPITAVAVMQLMERRKLTLDDSILKWLPELPSTWRNITIRHLLSHQSGIPDCCSGVLLSKFQEMDGVDDQQLLRRYIADDKLLFAPGTDTKYSNTNYVLLAVIIGKAAGMPYAQYLQENIFTPLGMRSTYVYGCNPPAGASAALNYGRTSKIYGITYALAGPVGIFSTTSDLNAFATGLLTDKLVSRDTLRLMTSDLSHAVIDWRNGHYGYGWYVPEEGTGLSIFGHVGGSDGFGSFLRIDYKTGVAAVILGNGGDATSKTTNAVFHILEETYN